MRLCKYLSLSILSLVSVPFGYVIELLPKTTKDIYTPAVFAFQARLQRPAFGFIGGRCDLHRICWTVVETSKF